MNERREKLLLILKNSANEYQTSKNLADKLNVSIRTIKNDIKDINITFPDLIISSNRGYKINKEEFYYKKIQKNIPDSPIKRSRFILNLLLKSEKKYSIYDFSDLLYFSESTIQNDLVLIKDILEIYNLNLITKNDFIYIKGSENSKRRLLTALLYEELENNFFSLESISNLVPNVNVEKIKICILEILNKNNLVINDFGLYNCIIHLAVKIERIKLGNQNEGETFDNFNRENPDLISISPLNNIILKLESEFEVTFSNYDVFEIKELIWSKVYKLEADGTKSIMNSNIGNDHINFTNKILKNINTKFGLNIVDTQFIDSFSLHVKNLINRINTKKSNFNPLKEAIKLSSPFIYEIAVYVAKLINKEYDYIISDDEIAFIAIHIGGILDSQRKNDSKIVTYILLPKYYTYTDKLINFLNENHSNDLDIKLITSSIDDLKNIKDSELVISVFKQPTEFINTNWVNINLFLNDKDTNKIYNKIIELKNNLLRKKFKLFLKELCDDDLFIVDHRKKIDKEQLIRELSNKFETKKLVNKSFYKYVIKREQLSPTSFGKFAIPHSTNMQSIETKLIIYINKNGINWSGNIVNLVMLPCFSKFDRSKFNEFFDLFTSILINEIVISDILETKTLDEFINCLLKHLD